MSNLNRRERPYEIGRGKPPKKHQFKKGQSGNPKGRPKNKADETIEGRLIAALNERLPVTENGQRKMMTKLEAAFKQVTNKAASGDMRALKMLIQWLMLFDNGTIVRPVTLIFEKGDEQL